MSDRKSPTAADEAVRAFHAGGDPEECSRALFERYHRPLVRFFGNRGFSVEDGRDLAQETLIRVTRGLDGFTHGASVDTWVFTIAENLRQNAERDRHAQKRDAPEVELDAPAADSDDGAPPKAALLADPRPDPLERTLGRDLERAVARAVAELPPRMRTVVELRWGRELHYGEIARALQISTETVKSQLQVARERLRPRLAPLLERSKIEEPES